MRSDLTGLNPRLTLRWWSPPADAPGVCGVAVLVCLLICATHVAGARAAATLRWSMPVKVVSAPEAQDLGYLAGVACPTPTQCTAVDGHGTEEVTFNPLAPGGAQTATIDHTTLSGVACPTQTQCTAVDFGAPQDVGANEVTFNPHAPSGPPFTTITSGSIGAVACPSATQCTALDAVNGVAVTFNPQTSSALPPVTVAAGAGRSALACPTATQCTVVEGTSGNTGAPGSEVTFNPQAPGSPAAMVIDQSAGLGGVACPTQTQCTALDTDGDAVTFNPQAPAGAVRETVTRRRDQLGAPACPTVSECVITDFTAGAVLQGDPRARSSSWTTTAIPGKPTLSAAACPNAGECVAVDFRGEETTGTLRSTGGTGAHPAFSVARPRTSGGVASVIVRCRRSAPGPCHAKLTLTGVETIRAGTVTSIAAARSGRHGVRTRTVVLGRSTASRIPKGATRSVKISVDRAGRRLLARLHRFTLRLSVTGRSGTGASRTLSRVLAFRVRHD